MDRINPVLTENENGETHAKNVASSRRKWLSMLLDTGNEKVAAAYQKYDQLHKENINNSGIMPKSGAINPIRPLTGNELSKMSNTQIAVYLNNYKETKIIGLPMLEGQGLADTLTECVEAAPHRFTDDLLPFQGVRNLYLSALLQGFYNAWRDKKEFDWAELLKFIYQILSSEQFWTEQHEIGFNYRNWFFSSAADLISEGTKNDKQAFDAQLLPIAEEILFVLAGKAQQRVSTLNNLLTDVLNSDQGKVFSAMINYSLRCARINEKKLEVCRWPQSIKSDFTKRLDQNVEPSLEFFFTLGFYLPYLSYLDKQWVLERIDSIFPQHNEDHWQAAFSGYLRHPGVNEDLYFLLKEHGHYQKALKTQFADIKVLDKLVKHICIGWIEDHENLTDKDSLIYQLIHDSNPNLLSDLAYFFSRHKDDLPENVKEKVIPTWRVLFKVLSQHSEEKEYQAALSPLSMWLGLIDKIDDEVLAWVRVSINYLDKVPGYAYTLSTVIEALQKHVLTTPEKVAQIYLEIPTREMSFLGQTKKDEVEETMRILYKNGYKDIANEICNRFGKAGVHFLRDIYEVFQTQ